MSILIVIRITPQAPVTALTTAGINLNKYLNPSMGKLSISAHSLTLRSFENEPQTVT